VFTYQFTQYINSSRCISIPICETHKMNISKSLPIMGEITRLVKAATGKESLRTTLPMSIVKQWGLNAGDEIDWSWEVIKGDMVVRVRKATRK
jgi:hypothetical protein